MDLAQLDYDHPAEAVAQRPSPTREAARLLDVPRLGSPRDLVVADLPLLFVPGDVLVLNDSRVQPVRLLGSKATGGRAEVLLLTRRPDGTYVALIGASRSPLAGSVLEVGQVRLHVLAREGEMFVVRAEGADLDLGGGVLPLPPYIRRPADGEDLTRYQCLHARPEREALGTPGASAAAPTAGLHLTPEMLARLAASGVIVVKLGLGVGLGTFRPIEARRVEDHRMHEEPFEVPADTAREVSLALSEGRRVTAVGTTTLRALEAAATPGGRVRAVSGWTGLFIVPGSRLRTASRLLTNFHQPRTSLLALVQAYAGRERVMSAYREAIARGYRLFSYGDCMLLERSP